MLFVFYFIFHIFHKLLLIFIFFESELLPVQDRDFPLKSLSAVF